MSDKLWSGNVFKGGETLPPLAIESVRIFEPADQYPVVSFKVHGIPRPQGSKRAFLAKNSKRIILREQVTGHEDHRANVNAAGAATMNGHPLLTGPLRLGATFVFPRPKSHFNSKGELRPNAPVAPLSRGIGDLSKLVRSIEDAMIQVVYEDDSQITAFGRVEKVYGIAVGTFIRVEPLT